MLACVTSALWCGAVACCLRVSVDLRLWFHHHIVWLCRKLLLASVVLCYNNFLNVGGGFFSDVVNSRLGQVIISRWLGLEVVCLVCLLTPASLLLLVRVETKWAIE